MILSINMGCVGMESAVVSTSDTLNKYGLCRDRECCCKYKP